MSLPPIHPGDLGLGDPFWVMCESVEAVHLISGSQLMVGCDNNLPNSGRNPALPDDNEFIVVNVPGMRSLSRGKWSPACFATPATFSTHQASANAHHARLTSSSNPAISVVPLADPQLDREV